MSGWKKVRLGDICTKIGSGATPKGGGESYCLSGISLIRSQNILDWNFSNNGLAFINEDQALKLKNVIIEKEDILLNITGDSVARACIVPLAVLPARVNQHVAIIRVDKTKANSYFILCVIQSIKPYLLSISASGGTRNALTKAMIEGIEINLPPLVEQERIANILGSLDDKIELNNKINKNLEEQASVLFKRWFVDFEFPDSNGNPYKSAGGEFIDSPLGATPKDWSVGKIGDLIISTLSGDWGKENTEGNFVKDVYCIRGADIPEVSKGNMGKMPIRYILPKNHATKKLSSGDIVVEISGGSPTQSTGRVALIGSDFLSRFDKDMVCTNFCRAVKPKEGYSTYAYYLWKYLYVQDVMFSYENGTTGIKNLDISGLLETEQVVIPDINTVAVFTEIINRFNKIIYSNAKQIQSLTHMRDSLLPKLMNNVTK